MALVQARLRIITKVIGDMDWRNDPEMTPYIDKASSRITMCLILYGVVSILVGIFILPFALKYFARLVQSVVSSDPNLLAYFNDHLVPFGISLFVVPVAASAFLSVIIGHLISIFSRSLHTEVPPRFPNWSGGKTDDAAFFPGWLGVSLQRSGLATLMAPKFGFFYALLIQIGAFFWTYKGRRDGASPPDCPCYWS